VPAAEAAPSLATAPPTEAKLPPAVAERLEDDDPVDLSADPDNPAETPAENCPLAELEN